MVETVYAVILFVLALAAFAFLIYRLSFFSSQAIHGRYPFLISGITLLLASAWQILKTFELYSEWFVGSAYPIFDAVQFILMISGILLGAAGLALYADFWQLRKVELDDRDNQFSIINNLQKDARKPFQIFELLNISLKEIIGQLEQTGGAFFLVNRSRRQLILSAYAGISQNETASLEHFQLGENIVTQAIETGDPVIGGKFEFGGEVDSRFHSSLALPVISTNDKYGVIVLFSEKHSFFSQSEINYLMPIADWLGEKIKSARLTKELGSLRDEIIKHDQKQNDFKLRIYQSVANISNRDAISGLCRALTGLFDTSAVHLIGMKNSNLTFFGGSEPLFDLSENFKTALVDALDRDKPLILNQESGNGEAQPSIARSTLIYPLKKTNSNNALMFIRDSHAIQVDDDDLKLIDLYGHLAEVVLKQYLYQDMNLSRRKGLEKITGLLQFDQAKSLSSQKDFFIEYLKPVLPEKTIGLMFIKNKDGSFKPVTDNNPYEIDKMEIYPAEGIIGSLDANSRSTFIDGRKSVEECLNQFEATNKNHFNRMFSENGWPNFMAVCPVYSPDDCFGAALIFMYDISEEEKSEWQRLLTLSAGLYSIRLTIEELRRQPVVPEKTAESKRSSSGQLINRLNNHLSVIVGQSELLSYRDDLSETVKEEINKMISEAEQAALLVKDASDRLSGSYLDEDNDSTPELNNTIEEVLNECHISDNLFMVGGRPREIQKTLDSLEPIDVSLSAVKKLFEEVTNRFASIATDEDIFTVSTYTESEYIYLDLSRHHKNFPAVEQVAGFGEYQLPDEVIKFRPADSFLSHLMNSSALYAFDRHTSDPTYLSFRFPIKSKIVDRSELGKPRILAIDDQQLILDLITAMCQTVGYSIQTADSGQAGLELAMGNEYDVILTDLAMPGMSGLEVAEEIRKKKPGVPIILITGWEVNIDSKRMDAAGIVKVLYKPFRIEQLTEIINNLIKQKNIS